jgi:glycine dehydrogenase subunit 1
VSYLGYSPDEEARMLAAIGVGAFEDLIQQVPPALRLKGLLPLAPAMSETELHRYFVRLARRNYDPETTVSFLGGGSYDHAIPALIDHLVLRSEFYTAYTPYQAEVSQGTLAGIYEFQTMICELTGLDVANAGMYDGASAAAEALLLARSATRRERVLLAGGVHPRIRELVRTYLDGSGAGLEILPESDGRLTPEALRHALEADPVAAVLVQQPNFYGLLEPLDALNQALGSPGPGRPHLVVSADPITLGWLAAPAELGAESAVGDVQSLGVPAQFGGPTGGYLATRQAHLRRLPGRLVAEARDHAGRRGFTLTLQTREQHIRREKATSNICTNSALIGLRATIYLALVGPAGLREVGRQCLARGQYALERLLTVKGVERVHRGPFFREFVLRLPRPADEVVARVLEQAGILAGIPLARHLPGRERELLVAVTEKRSREEIDALVAALSRALS